MKKFLVSIVLLGGLFFQTTSFATLNCEQFISVVSYLDDHHAAPPKEGILNTDQQILGLLNDLMARMEALNPDTTELRDDDLSSLVEHYAPDLCAIMDGLLQLFNSRVAALQLQGTPLILRMVDASPYYRAALNILLQGFDPYAGFILTEDTGSGQSCDPLNSEPVSESRFFEEQKIAYLKIRTFNAHCVKDEILIDLVELLLHRPRALMLDLRGNSGGLLEQTIAVANLFLPQHFLIASVVTREPALTVQPIRSSEEFNIKIPLVVLVDSETASAAEILAAALQDSGSAVVMGERTFGKGCGQIVGPAHCGEEILGTLQATVLRIYRPCGSTIQRWGVAPDLKIGPQEGTRFEEDPRCFTFPMTFTDQECRLEEQVSRRSHLLERLNAVIHDLPSTREIIADDPVLSAALTYTPWLLERGVFSER